MFSSGFNGSPMHSPSMMASTSQKRFFGQDYPALTPLSPMHQQQRQDYNAYGGAQGRNGHLTEERDTSLSLSSPRYGTSMQSHLSPRNRHHGGFSPKNSSYPHGDIGQLQGVWNAYESVTSELEKELRDCLSNKAIFEACVVQEQCHHQGKRMSTVEKNEEANLRKMKYENVLDVAINRQKGLFSSAVMAAQKEIQNSMDRKVEEHRQHLSQQLSRQLADMERSFANRSSEQELSYTRQKENFKREINRLQNECNQADSAIQKLKNDMSIQRQTLTQSLHAAEEGREAAVTELTATIGTLKSTCASAQKTETKFHQVEKDLAELQHTLNAEMETNQILRSAEEEMKQVISFEHERCDMLQRKNQEMEYSLQDTCKNLEQANQENSELREQVKEVSKLQDALSATIKSLRESKQEFEKLSEEFDGCQENLQQKAELNSILVGKVSALESQIEEMECSLQDTYKNIEQANQENSELREDLQAEKMSKAQEKMSKAQLEASLEECMKRIEDLTLELQAAEKSEADVEASLQECMKKIEDQNIDLQAARMSEADVEASLEECMNKIDELTSLQKNLQDMQELNEKEHSQQMEALKQATAENEKVQHLNSILEKERDELMESMKKLEKECNEERDKIASALEGFDEEMASAAIKLRSTQKELEEEKAKVKAHELSLEEATKEMEDKLRLMKEENESAYVKFEKEASVYNEAIKMLQKQVDLLQGLVDTGCEKCTRNKLASDEAYESSVVKELEEKLKKRDDEIMHLKDKCVKREESMVTLEKLCAKARNDLITVRNENKSLEVEIQRYTNFHDVANCDDGTSKAVDELLGPIIDAAPSMNDIDNMIDIGEKELKNIMTYVANEIGASCGEGVEITLNEQDRNSARRQLDPPDDSVP